MLILRNILAFTLCAAVLGTAAYNFAINKQSEPESPLEKVEVRHKVIPPMRPITANEKLQLLQSEQPPRRNSTSANGTTEKRILNKEPSVNTPVERNYLQQKTIRKSSPLHSHVPRRQDRNLRPPYGIHVGSYKKNNEAEKHITRLAHEGVTGKDKIFAKKYPFFDKKGEGFLQVIFGPFYDFEVARIQAQKIKKKGEFASIVHFPGSLTPLNTQALPAKNSNELRHPPLPVPPYLNPKISHAVAKSDFTPPKNLKVQPVIHGDMIMDVTLDYVLIYPGMLCIGKSGTLYLPLSEMTLALEFPISVDPFAGTASGWFLSNKRKFNLDIEKQTISADKKQFHFNGEQVFAQEEEIYIELKLFNKMFPLRITPDYYQMQLVLTPFEPLPRQVRTQRGADRNISQSGIAALKYPISDLNYALLAPPRLDAKISGAYTSPNGGKDYTTGHAAGNYRGDLLFFSASTYFSGSYSSKAKPEFEADSFTLEAEKIFNDNELLKKIKLGDITPIYLKNVPSSSRERGVYLTNSNPMRTSNYDVKTFTGTTIPGWEVELYRNGRLVSFTTVGEDGRYAFEDVPLLYGRNDFKMIIYGTEGQVEEREESIRIDSRNRRPGELVYETSISQINEDVWDPKGGIQTDDTGKLRLRAQISTGLTENISMSVGGASESLNGERKNSATAGLLAGIGNTLAQVDTAVNSNNGGVTSLQWRGQVSDYSFQASHKQQYGKIQSDDSTRQSSSASISSSTRIKKDLPLSYGVTADRYVLEPLSGEKNTNYSMGTSMGLSSGSFKISNNLGVRYEEQGSNSGNMNLTGQMTVSDRIEKVYVRGSASYQMDADTPMKNVTINLSRPITQTTNGEVGVEANMADQDYVKYHGQLSWAADKFNLFTRFEAEDSGTLSGTMGISTAMDFSPREWWKPQVHRSSNVQSGGLSCRVFQDNDFDGEYSDRDTPIEGVVLKTPQFGRKVTTDENGLAEFNDLPPMYASDVEIVESSLRDPRYVSSKKGAAIIPRKGRIYTMDFPLVLSGEIEGTAFSALSGTPKQKSGIPLELINEKDKLISSTYSDFDGYYFFSGVVPGKYQVRVSEQYLKTRELEYISDGKMEMKKNGGTISECTVLVGKNKQIKNDGTRLLAEARKNSGSSDTDLLIAQMLEQNPAPKKVHLDKTFAISRGKKIHKSDKCYNNIIVEVFTSRQKAEKGLKHYSSRYRKELRGGQLKYIQAPEGFLLVASFPSPGRNFDELAQQMLLGDYYLKMTKKYTRLINNT